MPETGKRMENMVSYGEAPVCHYISYIQSWATEAMKR
jgi:hypothetical protein